MIIRNSNENYRNNVQHQWDNRIYTQSGVSYFINKIRLRLIINYSSYRRDSCCSFSVYRKRWNLFYSSYRRVGSFGVIKCTPKFIFINLTESTVSETHKISPNNRSDWARRIRRQCELIHKRRGYSRAEVSQKGTKFRPSRASPLREAIASLRRLSFY